MAAEPQSFDVEAFLARPLVARIATVGPTVRPVWYVWEEGAFWILTGPWSKLPTILQRNPFVALVVDTCDLSTGEARQVIARGEARLLPWDVARGRRMLTRYLGADEQRWDRMFLGYLYDDPAIRAQQWAKITPASVVAKDVSFTPS